MSVALIEGTPSELTRALSGRGNLVVSENIYQLRGVGPIFTLVTCITPHCEVAGDTDDLDNRGCDAQCFLEIGARRILRYDDPEYYECLPVV